MTHDSMPVFPPSWWPGSWRERHAQQAVHYPETAALDQVCAQLRQFPPLVFAGEVQSLRRHLAEVAAGRAFLLQGGDCAESFDALNGHCAQETFRVLLQMAVVLTYAAARPVVKIGRMAGQYAKPRSSPTETRDGVTLPSYRGDIINNADFTAQARTPDPQRMLRAYSASASTINLLRALAQGGFADLHHLHAWTADFVRQSPQGQRYAALAERIGEALAFMTACGFGSDVQQLRRVDFYTSHEALLLPYEEALTRRADGILATSDALPMPSIPGVWDGLPQTGATDSASAPSYFAASAHMLWLGERTRQLDGAHVEYLRGIINPVGVKIGPQATTRQVLELVQVLNPQREPGRLLLITRMGAGTLAQRLPDLVAAVRDAYVNQAASPVIWCCDPMHGNTITTSTGLKTRDFTRIVQEVREFFAVHAQAGTVPGGLHVELTGQDVTECRGGAQQLDDTLLHTRYTTACDPRLNGSQSLELAFLVANLLKAGR